MSEHEFFRRYGEYVVPAQFYENRAEFTVEEMYQAFKARLLGELMEASDAYGDDDLSIILQRAADNSGTGT